jgi:hypothetical protein
MEFFSLFVPALICVACNEDELHFLWVESSTDFARNGMVSLLRETCTSIYQKLAPEGTTELT